MRPLHPALLTFLLLTGCVGGGGDEFQARQEAGIHQIAQAAARQPGVACAFGVLDAGGLPTALPGYLAIVLERGEATTLEQEFAVLRRIAEDIWTSDLAVSQLSVEYEGGPSLGGALGTPDGFVDRDELEAAFGPRPPRPSPPLPPIEDPGNPDC